jgi:redox-sensitive bicupin YhaK (pirin superfamily)
MSPPSRRALLVGAGALAVPAALGGLTLLMKRPPPHPRRVLQLVAPSPTRDGAGVKLSRLMGGRVLPMLDPFLLLDEFGSEEPKDYLAGFPEHPHRGFETVTILLAGSIEHQDSVGNRGLLVPGGLQWMTAGRGIVHSEMPRPYGRDSMAVRGFQLWVNLPAAHKWTAPRYQDLPSSDIPELDQGDGRVRVLAGQVGQVEGPVRGVVAAPTVLDVTIPAGGTFRTELPAGHTAFVMGVEGAPLLGPESEATAVPAGHLGVLGPGETVLATGQGRMLLVAGAPIGEPVARRGPFVMNTDEEIRQAIEDYQSGRLVGG